MPDGVQRAELWLAPLRGVTIRAFREAFAAPIREAGFAGAFAPFIPANPGLRVNDRMLDDLAPFPSAGASADALPVVPQVITKDPASMRELLKGLKDRGFARADLNAGCPFPMILIDGAFARLNLSGRLWTFYATGALQKQRFPATCAFN